jgi:transcriptional regulator with XRE-family HTH domain
MTNDLKLFTGKRISERRRQRNMSQEELAFHVATNQRQISRYERGENDPTGDVLVKIADALETTTDWLLGRTNTPDRPLRDADDLDDFEKETVKLLRSKTPEQKLKIVEIIKLVS